MGKVITALVVISVVFSAASGNAEDVSSALAGSASDAAELAVTLAASMAFWSGMMRLAQKCGLVDKVCRFVKPLLSLLMPSLSKDGEALQAASMNLTANLLGIGNAATPLGIKAMKALERERADRRTISLFVLLNTSSVQLLPMTVMTLRAKAGSSSPADCILPILFNSAAALCCGMIMLYLFYGGQKCRYSLSRRLVQPH